MKSLIIRDVKVWTTAPAGTPLVVVKVETSDPEISGFGCATFSWRYTAVCAVINDYLKDFLIGKNPSNIEDLWQTMMVNAYWRNGPVLNNAISGVEMALWDIKGKVADMPCYELWGGKSRPAVPVYVHADGPDNESILEAAQKFIEQGFTHIRCQLGGYQGTARDNKFNNGEFSGKYYNSTEKLIKIPELFAFLRKQLPEEVELLHDVHERLTPVQAIYLAKRMEEYRLFFLEDIIAPEDIGWLKQLRNQCATPLALGELFSHPNTVIPLLQDKLIDFLRIHLSDMGGIIPCLKLAHMAEYYGIRTAWHGPGDLNPVGLTASAHLDLHLNNFGIQEWAFRTEIEHEMFDGIPQLKDGCAYVNDKPGWGIAFNEKMAEKYPCTPKPTEWTLSRRYDGSINRP
jgi:mannonate dehydratase